MIPTGSGNWAKALPSRADWGQWPGAESRRQIVRGMSVRSATLRFSSNEDPGTVEVDGHRGRS